MIDYVSQPWPWYVSGPIIAIVMALLILMGKSFGVSSNLRTLCAMGGAGAAADFFRFDWRSQVWNLVFVLGTVFGGFVAANFLTGSEVLSLNPATVADLEALGFSQVGQYYLPEELFSTASIGSLKTLGFLLFGGILVGFGTRYAGGCTSGHAISGLSNFQVPSLIAVVGFFIGGLTMTFLIFPLIFGA